MTPPDSAKDKVIGALRAAWDAERGVRDFLLRFDPNRIREEAGIWNIPVASGVSNGSARELLRVLDRLEEAVECTTSLDVTVYLDPRGPQSTNGNSH